MNQVMIDIWPYLFPPMLLVIGWLFRQVFSLKTELAETKKSVESLANEVKKTIENIEKTIESIQKRQDSHSKKQDDILDKMGTMEKEFIKQVGSVRADISALSSDLRGFSNLILASDKGLTIQRQS